MPDDPASGKTRRVYIRPAEEIPPDELPFVGEKTDIHGRTIAQLEDIIARAKRVAEISASYKGAEELAKRLERARRNIEIDEGYLLELRNRPDDWPRDGGEALAYSLQKHSQKRRDSDDDQEIEYLDL